MANEPAGLRPPILKTNPRFIFFTDFDGTITQQDSNDFLIDNFGIGPTQRKLVFNDILFGRRSFRDAFKELLDGIELPLEKCIAALLQNITLDEGFREFYTWTHAHNIPVVVLSGGMEPIIRALLAHLLGEDEASTLPILSSGVAPRPGKSLDDKGGWKIAFRDDRQVP
jgi:2,3-diketo-5-methylthio-1-phosphopentane phosphatase